MNKKGKKFDVDFIKLDLSLRADKMLLANINDRKSNRYRIKVSKDGSVLLYDLKRREEYKELVKEKLQLLKDNTELTKSYETLNKESCRLFEESCIFKEKLDDLRLEKELTNGYVKNLEDNLNLYDSKYKEENMKYLNLSHELLYLNEKLKESFWGKLFLRFNG